jgi:hypothetical protein
VSAPGDYDNGEIGGMIGRGNRSTRRKPAPVLLCPPQIPHTARTRNRAAAVGSQRLTAELRHGQTDHITFKRMDTKIRLCRNRVLVSCAESIGSQIAWFHMEFSTYQLLSQSLIMGMVWVYCTCNHLNMSCEINAKLSEFSFPIYTE